MAGHVVAVVKDLEAAGRAPLVEPSIAELAQAVAAKIERRREQNQPIDVPSPRGLGGVHGDEGPQARPDDRDGPAARGVESPARIREHPRHGQGLERRLIEIRTGEPDATARQFLLEPLCLRRRRRRGEAVKVDDVGGSRHRSVRQPGLQRQRIVASPSVL